MTDGSRLIMKANAAGRGRRDLKTAAAGANQLIKMMKKTNKKKMSMKVMILPDSSNNFFPGLIQNDLLFHLTKKL